MKSSKPFACEMSLVLALASWGCGGGESPQPVEPPPGSDTPLSERLGAIDYDLGPGSRGPGVRAVHEYLFRYGYLPNDELMRQYPAWRPLVTEAPSNLDEYDERTMEAVQLFQLYSALPETGIVDEATRATLVLPRCGVPDGIRSADSSEKYALVGPGWSDSVLGWKIIGTDEVPPNQARAAAASAFQTWSQQTAGVGFVEVASGQHITLSFEPIDGVIGGILGAACPPGLINHSCTGKDGKIRLDTGEVWSTAVPTPPNGADLETVMLHEIGHALGLHHSSFSSAAVMWSPHTGMKRGLSVDDSMAISARYDNLWQTYPGQARDIASGLKTWKISNISVPGGYQIAGWNTTTAQWQFVDGGAVRIAVDTLARPWVVNSNGNIFRRTSSDPTQGFWELLPGCAKDIGIGATQFSPGTVWVIGCVPIGDGFSIHKWNGSDWDHEQANGGAIRLAVSSDGVPWVVTSFGNVFRRTSSNPSTGSWQVLPGVTALDIGIQFYNYAWVTSSNGKVFTWDEQVDGDDGPGAFEWIELEGAPSGASNIGVDSQGRPFMTNSSFQTFFLIN